MKARTLFELRHSLNPSARTCTSAVFVEDHGAFIALTHVDPVNETTGGAE